MLNSWGIYLSCGLAIAALTAVSLLASIGIKIWLDIVSENRDEQ